MSSFASAYVFVSILLRLHPVITFWFSPGLGSSCSGPTWVRSIREGELDLDFDGHHMFSRLNSNYVGWLSQNNDKKTKVFCDTWPGGQHLSTKSVGSEQLEDITGNYKYELGMMKSH